MQFNHKIKKKDNKKKTQIYNFNSDEDNQYDINFKSTQSVENDSEYSKSIGRHKNVGNIFDLLDEKFKEKDNTDNKSVLDQTKQETAHLTNPQNEVLKNLENFSIKNSNECEQPKTEINKKEMIQEQNEKKKTRKERKIESKKKILEVKMIKDTLNEKQEEVHHIYSYASGSLTDTKCVHLNEAISVTGNLISQPNSKNLQVDKVTIQAYGKLLIKESELNLINGRRYGLIAPNGV